MCFETSKYGLLLKRDTSDLVIMGVVVNSDVTVTVATVCLHFGLLHAFP